MKLKQNHNRKGILKKYDFFEDHGITMEARVSLVLNVFMYVDDCINIEAYNSKDYTAEKIAQIIASMPPETLKTRAEDGTFYRLEKFRTLS